MTGGLIDGLSWIAIVAGSFFAVVGGIGLLRLPDFFTRIHGAGLTDTLGAGLILAGLMLQSAASWIEPAPRPATPAAAVEAAAAHDGEAGSAGPGRFARIQVTLKLAMILFLLFVTSPTSAHALAKSALSHGVEPWLADGDGAAK